MRLAQLPLLLSTLAVFFGLLRAAGIRLAAAFSPPRFSSPRPTVPSSRSGSTHRQISCSFSASSSSSGPGSTGAERCLRGFLPRRACRFVARWHFSRASRSRWPASRASGPRPWRWRFSSSPFSTSAREDRAFRRDGLLATAGALSTGLVAAALLAASGALGAAWEQGVRLNALYERLDLPRQGPTALELAGQSPGTASGDRDAPACGRRHLRRHPESAAPARLRGPPRCHGGSRRGPARRHPIPVPVPVPVSPLASGRAVGARPRPPPPDRPTSGDRDVARRSRALPGEPEPPADEDELGASVRKPSPTRTTFSDPWTASHRTARSSSRAAGSR